MVNWEAVNWVITIIWTLIIISIFYINILYAKKNDIKVVLVTILFLLLASWFAIIFTTNYKYKTFLVTIFRLIVLLYLIYVILNSFFYDDKKICTKCGGNNAYVIFAASMFLVIALVLVCLIFV